MRILSVVVFAFFTLFAAGCRKQQNNKPRDPIIQKATPIPPSFVRKPPSAVVTPTPSLRNHDSEWRREVEPQMRGTVVQMEKDIPAYLSGATTPAGLRGLINLVGSRISVLRTLKPFLSETYARQIDEFISRLSALLRKLQTALDNK